MRCDARVVDAGLIFGGNGEGTKLLWAAVMLIGVAAALAFQSQSPVRAQARRQAARDRHVVVISIDGFAAFSWNDPMLAVPTLRRLAREGAAAEAMIPVNPTVTWPNHTSMVTGVRPERHSVLYNGWAVRGAEGERSAPRRTCRRSTGEGDDASTTSRIRRG